MYHIMNMFRGCSLYNTSANANNMHAHINFVHFVESSFNANPYVSMLVDIQALIIHRLVASSKIVAMDW